MVGAAAHGLELCLACHADIADSACRDRHFHLDRCIAVVDSGMLPVTRQEAALAGLDNVPARRAAIATPNC